jgi:hypothetical protein
MLQDSEVQDDDAADEDLEDQQEPALRQKVGLAGFVDQLGDLAHGFVHRQIAQVHVHGDAENETERADGQADQQQRGSAIGTHEGGLVEVGELEARFAAIQGRGPGYRQQHQQKRRQNAAATRRQRGHHSFELLQMGKNARARKGPAFLTR